MTTKDKAVITIAYRAIKATRDSIKGEFNDTGRLSMELRRRYGLLNETVELIEDNFSRWLLKGSGVLETVIDSLEETMETRT